MATTPLIVADMPEDKRPLGYAFNICAYTLVTTQCCIVMFSTYVLLMFTAHGHSPDIIYRAIARLSSLLGCFQLGIYVPLVLWLITMVLSAHISMSNAWERWACTGVVITVYFIFHMMFVYATTNAFPRGMWGWLGLTAPWLYFSRRLESDVARMCPLYLAGAEKGVLEGKDTNCDGKIEDASEHTLSPEEQTLMAWVDTVLPEKKEQGIQRALLIRALVNEGLTLSRLTAAGRLPGGFSVLMSMLELTQEEGGAELNRGERLALATAVMGAFTKKGT
jgi:hypothetical protein